MLNLSLGKRFRKWYYANVTKKINMLQKQQKKNNTKKALRIASATILGIFLLLLVLEKTNVTSFITLNKPSSTAKSDEPTPEQKRDEDALNAQNKQDLIEQEDEPSTASEVGANATGNIELSAKQEDNNTVTVFTKLYNYGDGTCELTVTNSGTPVLQYADVIYQAEYSSCAGFSVPIEGLGQGTWNITVKVSSNGTSGTKTISFKVS